MRTWDFPKPYFCCRSPTTKPHSRMYRGPYNADVEVPVEIKKAIAKLGTNFEGDVRKHLSIQDKVAQVKKDVEFMKQEGLRYPAGTRPFKSHQELADLDTVVPECAAHGLRCGYIPPKTSSSKPAGPSP